MHSKEPPKVIRGILKKPKNESEIYGDVSDLSKSQIGKSVSVVNPGSNLKTSEFMDRMSSSTPLSVVTAY